MLKQLKVKLSPEWQTVFDSYQPPETRSLFVAGGEGSGKSFQSALFAIVHSVYDLQFSCHRDDGKLYWVVGQDFETARMEIGYIRDFLLDMGNLKDQSFPDTKDKSCTLVTETGQLFTTHSGYDETKIGREAPDGIVGAEVTGWFQEVFERCEGRLVRKFPHAWGFFSGSFESSLGWVPDLWKYAQGPNDRNIRSFSVPSWANRNIYPGGEDDPAIRAARATRSPSKFRERFGGEPAPARAVIFSEFRTTQHVDNLLDYDPRHPVYVAIDPGTKVYCVLFVQLIDGEVHIVDEIYENRLTHEQIINEYRMRPGSVLVRGGAIDVASTQSHMGMPIPYQEWYKDTSLPLWIQKVPVEDSIERVRSAIAINPKTGRPRLRVHPRCKGIISEMGGGPAPFEGGGPWMYLETRNGLGPPRSENDHACKALAYLLAGPFGYATTINTGGLQVASYLTRK